MAKITIEIDVATGNKKVSGAKTIPLKNLTLLEEVEGAVVKHKILSISEGAEIRTNPNCHWVMIGGVMRYVCE